MLKSSFLDAEKKGRAAACQGAPSQTGKIQASLLAKPSDTQAARSSCFSPDAKTNRSRMDSY